MYTYGSTYVNSFSWIEYNYMYINIYGHPWWLSW